MPKTALILGGNGGIGTAVSEVLLAQAMPVYASYFRNRENLDRLQSVYPNCEGIQCDIRNEAEVKSLVESVLQKTNHVDLVVNCVSGALQLKPFDRLSSKEFHDDMNAILFGAIDFFQAILPQMKKQKSGVMINILTSTVTETPPARMSSYVIAKYALLGLTKCLATELDRFKVKVFGLSPAFVETEMINCFPEKLIEMEKAKQDDNRLLQPQDIAEAVWHFFEHADRHQTGENAVIKTKKDLLALKRCLV